MIFEFLMDIIFGIISRFLGLIPIVNWPSMGGSYSTAISIVSSVLYLLPVGAISSIITLIIGFTIFRIVISFIKTIWDLLPIV